MGGGEAHVLEIDAAHCDPSTWANTEFKKQGVSECLEFNKEHVSNQS